MGFKKFFAASICMAALSGTPALAQLPVGSFGIGADLSRSFSTANLLYAVTPVLQLEAGIGYEYRKYNFTYDVNGTIANSNSTNNSSLTINLGSKYFLKATGVLPYIGLSGFYNIQPENTNTQLNSATQINKGNSIGANVIFGAQYFIAAPIAIHAQFGFGYSMNESTNSQVSTNQATGITTTYINKNKTNSFNFGSTSLGASFYF